MTRDVGDDRDGGLEPRYVMPAQAGIQGGAGGVRFACRVPRLRGRGSAWAQDICGVTGRSRGLPVYRLDRSALF